MGRKNKKSRKRKLKLLKDIFNLGMFLLFVLIITFVLHTYVVERVMVHNHSMEPTLTSGNIILIDKLSYTKRKPKRYEIIVFENAAAKEDLIKRIIGLPGESVRIVHGKIYIDGELIDDVKGIEPPYNEGLAANDFVLGDDEYFVLGDNREVSIDSRSPEVGAITGECIKGKLFIRIKPLSKMWVK